MIGWMLGSDVRIACTVIVLAWLICAVCMVLLLLGAPELELLDAELES